MLILLEAGEEFVVAFRAHVDPLLEMVLVNLSAKKFAKPCEHFEKC